MFVFTNFGKLIYHDLLYLGWESTKNSAVRYQMLVCDNIVSFEGFSVLANGINEFRVKLQEIVLTHHDWPQLNKISESAPLKLFSSDVSH